MNELPESHVDLHPRLCSLPTATVLGHRTRVACGLRARLLGLAGLERRAAAGGLLIPRCRSVHTVGMRFALDLWFLDSSFRPIGLRSGVKPGRIACSRSAHAVLELPSAGGWS